MPCSVRTLKPCQLGRVSSPATGEFLETKVLQGQPTVAPYAPLMAGPNSALFQPRLMLAQKTPKLTSRRDPVKPFWKKNPSVFFLLCADLNIGCSKTKSSNDNPRHTARQINSTSVFISITVHSTEIVTIPKHTETMYITGIHNSCMSHHNYIPTKSDVFIIKQSFIKANSVHKSVRAHALQCPKRRHLHCNAKQHNIWVYVTYMCQYSQVLSTIP